MHAVKLTYACSQVDICKLARQISERLIDMLTEPGFRAQLHAMTALSRLGSADALPALGRVHRTAPDGRKRRMAYEAMVRIRRGKGGQDELALLRRRVEQLAEENGKMRERLDRLEPVDSAG